MRKSEIWVLASILLIAISGIAYSFLKPSAKIEPLHREPHISISAKDLLSKRHDFLGAESAPYTLVEFGDYECPPCRATRPQVKELLDKYKSSLKLDFRNLPLPQIHSSAMYSAIVAEAARKEHCFWRVHNYLYETVLSDLAIDNVMKENLKVNKLSNQQMQLARQAVNADMKLADKLGLDSTPTFLLCCPDGRVFKLESIENVKDYLTM